MGCTLSTQEAKTCAADGAKVIFPGGDIQCFYEPMKAAELMLQVPDFFLVSTASLHTGKRISPLKADEGLEMNQVYVFLPMKRLNSAVTAADMEAAGAGGMALKEARIVRDDEDCSAEDLDDTEDFQLRYRLLCSCRSRKPSLETIVEETINLRFMFMIEN